MTDQQDGAHGPPTPTFPMPDGLGEFSGFDAFAPPQQQELRGPRRSDVVTYTLRATLVDVDPPIWRQLDVASDLGLPQMHTVLQAAFGWADSHLHLFEKGERPGDHQQYLMDSSLDEGMTGTAESQVRLDEVLSVVGDTLTYEYDFGDSWVHTVVLEAITDRTPDAADAVCIDGARSGPPEDCGGAPGYEDLLQVLADPAHPRYPDLQEWLGREFTPETFDPAVVNLALQTVHQQALARQTLPAALTEIVDRVGGSPATQIWQLVFAADLGAEVEIDLATATEMT
ncbi:plasmid pRiA4b ORF-3 family protein, partial [Nakamurella silvestris]